MRVALVHDYLREYGGAERVLEVLHELYPDAPLYTAYYFEDKMPVHFKTWDIRASAMQHWLGIKKNFLMYTYAVPWIFEQFDLREYDVIISSSSFAAKGILTNPNQIHIDYCHTPTRFLWGINRSSNRKFAHALFSPIDTFVRQWDFASAQRVDFFVANSQAVQERIKRFYKRDSELIYPPIIDGEVSIAVSGSEGYFLVVSRLERLKNIQLIVSAFNQLGLPLKIAGSGSEEQALQEMARSNVEFLGNVNDTERETLYHNCKALIVATENEDFGMTVPEAQFHGRPVIALRSGGYLETIEEGKTGIFFDHLTVEELKKAVLAFEKSQFDSAVIKDHAAQFSKYAFINKWKAFTQKVFSEYSQ